MIFDNIRESGFSNEEIERLMLGDKRKILKYSCNNILYDELIFFYKAEIKKGNFITYKCFFNLSPYDFSAIIVEYIYNIKSKDFSNIMILNEKREYWKGSLQDQINRLFNEVDFSKPELLKEIRDAINNYLPFLKRTIPDSDMNLKVTGL